MPARRIAFTSSRSCVCVIVRRPSLCASSIAAAYSSGVSFFTVPLAIVHPDLHVAVDLLRRELPNGRARFGLGRDAVRGVPQRRRRPAVRHRQPAAGGEEERGVRAAARREARRAAHSLRSRSVPMLMNAATPWYASRCR